MALARTEEGIDYAGRLKRIWGKWTCSKNDANDSSLTINGEVVHAHFWCGDATGPRMIEQPISISVTNGVTTITVHYMINDVVNGRYFIEYL